MRFDVGFNGRGAQRSRRIVVLDDGHGGLIKPLHQFERGIASRKYSADMALLAQGSFRATRLVLGVHSR